MNILVPAILMGRSLGSQCAYHDRELPGELRCGPLASAERDQRQYSRRHASAAGFTPKTGAAEIDGRRQVGEQQTGLIRSLTGFI
jgi:hypothetical protein